METAHETPVAAEDARKAKARAYHNEYRRKRRQAKRVAKAAPKQIVREIALPEPIPQGAQYPGAPTWASTQPGPAPKPKPEPAPTPEDPPPVPKPNPDDDLIEVRLLHNYVPFDGAIKPPYPGNRSDEVVYEKIPAGTTIKIPRVEARRALQLGIAAIDHDLI